MAQQRPRPKVPGYILEAKIGSGTFADVFRAHQISRNSSRESFAVKCILKGKLSPSAVESIYTEIKLLKLLKHPHIVQMIDFCWDDIYIYIIMEFCEGGDLSTFIKTRQHLSEEICQSFLQQLASALEYLRQNSVSHMDLKPQNLLLTSKTNPKLKLTDFGLAQLLGNTETLTSLRGSPLYMAPEILLRQSYDASVDLWSTGIILYECLFGKAPYSSPTLGDLIDKIKSNAPINIPTTVKISNQCRNLLTRLIQRNPKQRITFDEFFRHPFVVGMTASGSAASISDNESKADSIVRRAENNTRDSQQALWLYNQAVQLLTPLPQNATESAAKARLSEKLNLCLRRVAELTSLLHSANSSSQRERELVTSDSTGISLFEELCSLASSTPSLKTALDIGIEGVQYDAEGQSQLAFDRYQLALETIIPLLNSKEEPKGRRRDLLHQQATLWMARAEKLKELMTQRDALTAEQVQTPEDLMKLLFLSSSVRSLLLAVGGGVCVILLMYIFPATIGVSRDQEL